MDKQPIITLQQMLINKFTDNPTLEINELPEHLSLLIKEERKKKNAIFQDNAFKDLKRYLDNYPDHMKRNKNINYIRFNYESSIRHDITYLMYHIRDNPMLLINLGYHKYTFEVKITKIVDDDDLYELTITEPASGFKSLYSEILGRFD